MVKSIQGSRIGVISDRNGGMGYYQRYERHKQHVPLWPSSVVVIRSNINYQETKEIIVFNTFVMASSPRTYLELTSLPINATEHELCVDSYACAYKRPILGS